MKNLNLKFAIVLLCIAVVLLVAATVIFSCTQVAFAQDDECQAIMAPISNLKDNEYAGISTIELLTWGATESIFVPESYYIIPYEDANNPMYRYATIYCGCYFAYICDEALTTPVSFDDGVSGEPDVRLFLNDGTNVIVGGNIVTNDYTIKLVGFNADGSKVYVRAMLNGNNYYGFVNKSDLQPFNVPYHPISQAKREELLASLPQPDVSGGDIIPNTSLALRIVLIIGIALPAVLIAVLLFKPTKNNKRVISQSKDFDYDEPQNYRQR